MMERSKLKVLVLDDDTFMLSLFARMLENLGFVAVTTCASGREALALMDRGQAVPDLVLLDLNMPEMDGIEFVRHLVDRGYGGRVILVSGEDERMLQSSERLARAHRIQVMGHLRKPVAPESLAELLDKALDGPASENHRAPRKRYGADEVRAAIANGELINHYQPQVEVASGRVVGVESLVRWNHPGNGMVFPDQFIGVAEEHGLIDDLTRVVLAAALAQARVWRDQGLVLRVAVNLSMDNLKSLDFADFVAEQAATAGIAPPSVVLEVTESRLMGDQRAPLEILTRLRLKRFRLSIDDFGTGHSTLAQLRNIPFDELKVDRDFVHGVSSDEIVRAMFATSSGLAGQLGIEVVAEGVEDRGDWEFLRSAACHTAQGYLIAKPMPAAELPDWIGHWEERLRTEFGDRA